MHLLHLTAYVVVRILLILWDYKTKYTWFNHRRALAKYKEAIVNPEVNPRSI